MALKWCVECAAARMPTRREWKSDVCWARIILAMRKTSGANADTGTKQQNAQPVLQSILIPVAFRLSEVSKNSCAFSAARLARVGECPLRMSNRMRVAAITAQD